MMKRNNLTLFESQSPNNKSKRNRLIVYGILFIFAAIFILNIQNDSERPWRSSVFYVSRDGVLYDLSTFDASIIRSAVTNSFDSSRGITGLNNPVLDYSITTAGILARKLERCEEITSNDESNSEFLLSVPSLKSVTSYSIEKRNVDSNELVSSEIIFKNEENNSSTRLISVVSDVQFLFATTPFDQQKNEQYFWCVKSENHIWDKIPLDFGINDNLIVLGWELLKEKESIFFLLYSEKEEKVWVSCYNYVTMKPQKTIPLPPQLCSKNAQVRIISGFRNFFVYRVDQSLKSIHAIVFSTQDLTKIKEIIAPNVDDSLNIDLVSMSPNLRYIAYGQSRLYLFDVNAQQSKLIYKSNYAFCRRLCSHFKFDLQHITFIKDFSNIWSLGFSCDSTLFSATDLFGGIYQWELSDSGVNKITQVKN